MPFRSRELPVYDQEEGLGPGKGYGPMYELRYDGENALCCGGGGGNFFTDLLGRGPDSPARARVREAAETGVEVLVVACPNCAKMLEDGVKAEVLEDRLKVMDVAELVQAP